MTTTTYYVHQHDDHFHVLAEDPVVRILDDRIENPWLYLEKIIAENVATLLNAGVDPQRVKAMEAHEICRACEELLHSRSGGVVLTNDLIEQLAEEAERGYDATQLRPRRPTVVDEP
jgi:hypothetical protein